MPRPQQLIAQISVRHAIPSFPRKREFRAVFEALALGARFRGHDETFVC